MSWITVHTWNESQAPDLLLHLGRAAGWADGEQVEIEAKDGQIDIRRVNRTPVEGSPEAFAALEEFIANNA